MAFGIDHLQPIIALIAGILILLIPRLLNFIVAVYLIVVGITGLFPNLLRSAALPVRGAWGASKRDSAGPFAASRLKCRAKAAMTGAADDPF
jgi:hypothetical protein